MYTMKTVFTWTYGGENALRKTRIVLSFTLLLYGVYYAVFIVFSIPTVRLFRSVTHFCIYNEWKLNFILFRGIYNMFENIQEI